MTDLLFLAHSYHQKTLSCSFLQDLLASEYRVTVRYLEPDFSNLDAVVSSLPIRHFQCLICWQIMPEPKRLIRSISFEKPILFPMFDGCPKVIKIEQWLPFSRFLIISFCHRLHLDLTRAGFVSKYFKFFPDVSAARHGDRDPRKAFFWYRDSGVPFELLLKICEELKVHSLHVHDARDPHERNDLNISDTKLNISVSTWFDNREELNEIVSSCGIYFSPRLREGIGMSFLEAMALGSCVVAYDAPTMNEYIEHGKNGLLFNFQGLLPGLSRPIDTKSIQNSSKASARKLSHEWIIQRLVLIDLIHTANIQPKYITFAKCLLFRFIQSPIRVTSRMIKYFTMK